jgi:phospholipase/lecithinase/hemolysin
VDALVKVLGCSAVMFCNPNEENASMKMLFGALALFSAISVPASANAALTSLSDLFVFGDSLSDGGNSGLASQAATGGSVVFPPPPYVGGRYSNGPVAVEQLWSSFNPGNTSFTPSLAGGTNYAIGGATSGLANYNSVNPNVPDPLKPVYANLGNAWQLSTYAGQGRSFNAATSLFVVWLFPNDVFNWAKTGNLPGTATGAPGAPGDVNALIGNGIANILTTVQTLAAGGATHFLVPNMPDLGKTPSGAADAGLLTPLTMGFNYYLAQGLTALDNALPSVDIVQFDTFAALNNMIADPGAYGFDNVTESCVDNLLNGRCNPDKWLFWDGAHPTTSADALLASQFRAAVVPEPETYALMAFGLLLIGYVARKRQKLG